MSLKQACLTNIAQTWQVLSISSPPISSREVVNLFPGCIRWAKNIFSILYFRCQTIISIYFIRNTKFSVRWEMLSPSARVCNPRKPIWEISASLPKHDKWYKEICIKPTLVDMLLSRCSVNKSWSFSLDPCLCVCLSVCLSVCMYVCMYRMTIRNCTV